MKAAYNGYTDIVKTLLEHGADVDTIDNYGQYNITILQVVTREISFLKTKKKNYSKSFS